MFVIFTSISRQLCVLIGVLLLMAGCASSGPAKKPSPGAEPATLAVDESFDPVLLKDDELSFPAASDVTLKSDGAHSKGAEVDSISANREVDGFRVQIFATQDIESATLQKKEAEFEFATEGIGVYIEFDSPLYKVRIGDCETREAANQLRDRIKQRGLGNAFVVKSRVNIIPALPNFEPPSTPEAQPRNN